MSPLSPPQPSGSLESNDVNLPFCLQYYNEFFFPHLNGITIGGQEDTRSDSAARPELRIVTHEDGWKHLVPMLRILLDI